MPPANATDHLSRLTSAVQAIHELCETRFADLDNFSGSMALLANTEIGQAPVARKSVTFFRHFLPLRQQMVQLLTESYRRYFKVALAHETQSGGDPDSWAWTQVQPALHAAFEWIREWYILACEGENQSVRYVGSTPFVPEGTASMSIPSTVSPAAPVTPWRAPAWLFGISVAHFGFRPLKTQHVPNMDPEKKLGESHTRLLLKGARRVFLWELAATCRTARNEETAAAGAIPRGIVAVAEKVTEQETSKPRLRGIQGLGPKKTDFSRYIIDKLTDKQQLAFSLKFEYDLGLAEIASRMGINRKTAYEHIEAAKTKMDQARSNEKRKAHHPRKEDE